MVPLTLSRRREQLDVVAAACVNETRATLLAREGGREIASGPVRMLELTGDGLYLSWPEGIPAGRLQPGTRFTVRFEHDARSYILHSVFRARHEHHRERGWIGTALEIAVPIRVDRLEGRESVRIRFPDHLNVQARLTAVFHDDDVFQLRLLNLSRGGAAGTTASPRAAQIRASEPYWLEFTLPGIDRPFEFVVRAVHARSASSGGAGETILGWAFCPNDDPRFQEDNLARLERYFTTEAAPLAEPFGDVFPTESNE